MIGKKYSLYRAKFAQKTTDNKKYEHSKGNWHWKPADEKFIAIRKQADDLSSASIMGIQLQV